MKTFRWDLPRLCVVALSLWTTFRKEADALGIPGTTSTLSGYDTELGEDAMCWSSVASATPEEGIPFPNGVLVQNFSLADQVLLHRSCPNGTWLTAQAPPEFDDPDFRPRTLQWYNYTVKGRLDVSALSDAFVASDTGSKVAVAILACDSVTAGFCSPFVHEQANIRLAKEMETSGVDAHAAMMKKKKVGDRHGGTHVHAPAVILDIPPKANVSFEFDVQVPVIINDPGHFFVVGTLQFFTGNSTSTPRSRYDVANALQSIHRLVAYQEPATILMVSDTVRILSYVIIGLASAVLLFLIGATIRYRSHQVMQIAQADFLIVFLFAALVATVSCVLLEPKNDLFCNLSQPMILIPLQLFYSITLGRLWRINSVVSPLLRDRLQRATSKRHNDNSMYNMWKKIRTRMCGDRTTSRSRRKSDLRRTVSASTVVWISAVCTLPQIAFQVASLVTQPQSKVVEYNESQTIGRCACTNGFKVGQSLASYALYLLLLLVVVLLIMAHVARRLPSLLNESSVIYDCSLLSILLLVLGEGVIAVTNAPTTSPDVPYMVNIVLVLSITLNASLRTMMPKLTMVWRGQQVLVSQLVEDHKQSLRRKSTFSKTSDMYNVTGLEDPSESLGVRRTTNSPRVSSHEVPSIPGRNHLSSGIQSSSFQLEDLEGDDEKVDVKGSDAGNLMMGGETEQCSSDNTDEDLEGGGGRCISPSHNSSQTSHLQASSSQAIWLDNVVAVQDEPDTAPASTANRSTNLTASCREPAKRRVSFSGDATGTSKQGTVRAPAALSDKPALSRKIVVKEGAAPSKQLMLRMIDLQGELDLINSRVMSGLAVGKDDWDAVRRLTGRLEHAFGNIEFEWETGAQQEK